VDVAKLVIRAGRNVGSEFKLQGTKLIIGRRSANAVPIADPKASREHAVINVKDEIMYVQDLSRNGLTVNGKPASKEDPGTPITFSDRIQIGDTIMELVDEKSEALNLEVPGYQIHEKVGIGGMGTVFKAKQLSMDRIVALKVLNERYSANEEFVDRFKREARAAGKLNHPNVIHVHDIAKANGRHFFSMEFVDGMSVKDLLRQETKIEINRAIDIVLQTARALEYAHENRIIHRDIKPDNIMITKEGIVKIADLGIAKTFEESAPSVKEQRRVMGTPHYMAPEQALGKPIDHRVDIYSLGATFYHLVTGTTPFTGSTAHAILKAHIQESLPPIQDLNAGVPDPICFIIERMMAKLPEKRYPSMSKLIEDIERVQRGNVKGIDRIEAGESTILRALTGKKNGSGKDAKDAKAAKDPKESKDPKAPAADIPEDEAETGAHKQIPRGLVAMGMLIVFAGVLAAVVFLLPKITGDDGGLSKGKGGEEPPKNVPPPTHQNPGPTSRSNPEAKKLLDAAIAAQAANDPSEYERNLKTIRERFPASEEASDAAKRLEALAGNARDAEKKRAEQLMKEAAEYDAGNPSSPAEAVKKYRAAMEAAQNQPALIDPAKTRIVELEKKIAFEAQKAVESAWGAARDTASSARTKYDYDGSRAALEGFVKAYPNSPQKDEAAAALEKVNTEATTKFKDAQDAAGRMEIPQALEMWTNYTTQVKDAENVNKAGEAIQALNARADQFASEELNKASEKAMAYQYSDALGIVATIRKKLSGINKWDETVKAREEAFKLQRTLHDRVLKGLQDGVKAGGILLPFKIETKFGDVKWKISRVDGERLSLDAVPAGSAPGTAKKLTELAPKEQYQLILVFMPEKLTAGDHKALAAFCAQRDLTDEAVKHEEKAQ